MQLKLEKLNEIKQKVDIMAIMSFMVFFLWLKPTHGFIYERRTLFSESLTRYT